MGVAIVDAAKTSERPAERISGSRARVVRLLAIEDEEEWAKSIEKGLADLVDVSFVATAGRARIELSTKPYDLVLLDLGLPDGDGIELLEWMRRGTFAGPVIVYTVRGNPRTFARLARLPNVRVLIKPCDEVDLQACLASCVVTPDAIDRAVASIVHEHNLSPRAGDASRLAEILRELAHGLSDEEVCDKLGIAHGTYRKYREQALHETRDDTIDKLVIRILLRAFGLS